MREIKFRAKSVIDDNWEFGYFTFEGGYHIIRSFDSEWHKEGSPIIVKGNTVGQYTGLIDKKGNYIFEGDIACDRYANFYTPIFRNGIYMAYNVKDLHLTEQEPSTQFNVVWKDGCEVIGNIYENPELLEVGK